MPVVSLSSEVARQCCITLRALGEREPSLLRGVVSRMTLVVGQDFALRFDLDGDLKRADMDSGGIESE
jgi:hypothetical protein